MLCGHIVLKTLVFFVYIVHMSITIYNKMKRILACNGEDCEYGTVYALKVTMELEVSLFEECIFDKVK